MLKHYLILLNEKFKFYFKFEIKKNQIKVMAFRLNITPRNIKANFLPMNAVSGSSFTLIKTSTYLNKDSIKLKNKFKFLKKKNNQINISFKIEIYILFVFKFLSKLLFEIGLFKPKLIKNIYYQ